MHREWIAHSLTKKLLIAVLCFMVLLLGHAFVAGAQEEGQEDRPRRRGQGGQQGGQGRRGSSRGFGGFGGGTSYRFEGVSDGDHGKIAKFTLVTRTRNFRDRDAEPLVLIVPNGPYSVKGGATVDGAAWGEGASPEHFTLCRCGHSKNKPFCSGAHWDHHFDEHASSRK